MLQGADTYVVTEQAWRQDRESHLTADDGWLTVVGLYWLREGRNTFGTDPANDMVFPPGSAAPRAGAFEFRDGRTVLIEESQPGRRVEMKPDSDGEPTTIQRGRLSFHVIQRGERFGIRLRDTQSEYRSHFTGLEWYPVNEENRVVGRFVPFEEPKALIVPSVLGDTQEYVSPGYVEFEWRGERCRLEPAQSEDELFFIFKDATSGRATYPAGRFLYAAPPAGGTVVLDFNRAYNPPCAFTPYATCPLPPPQNRLTVAVEAGEKNYHFDP